MGISVLFLIMVYSLSYPNVIAYQYTSAFSRRCSTFMSAISSSSPPSTVIKVALTREKGENAKLSKLLENIPNCELIELPCISFEETAEVNILQKSLQNRQYDGYILTSPQAAEVFLKYWKLAGSPPDCRIASVGAGTSKILQKESITPLFEPSQALGETLVAELPPIFAKSILYPCSALAPDTIVNGLVSRGIQVLFIPLVVNVFYNCMTFTHHTTIFQTLFLSCSALVSIPTPLYRRPGRPLRWH